MNQCKLSILICSLKERRETLQKLLDILRPQTNKYVEILVKTDDGEITIGAKRNLLLEKACGDYVCFVDDDDLVSLTYVQKILKAIQTKPDCCSLTGLMTNRKGQFPFVHSLLYKKWYKQAGIYYRCPNHLNVIKRELALQVMFKDIQVGEDKDFSTRLLPLLKKEKLIEGILYYYLTR